MNGAIHRVNDDGTYDVEFLGESKWLGIRRGIKKEELRKRGEKKEAQIWRWEDMSDEEDAVWADWSDEDDAEKEYDGGGSSAKNRVTFAQFNRMHLLLEAVHYDEELLMDTLHNLARVPGVNRFSEFKKLVAAVTDFDVVKAEIAVQDSQEVQSDLYGRDDMVLLNLLYSPRRSDLFSLMKVLVRIEGESLLICI